MEQQTGLQQASPKKTQIEILKEEREQKLGMVLQQAHETFHQQYGGEEGVKLFNREKEFAKMAVVKNSKILDCSPESIFNAISMVALTGLTLNPSLNLCYLIPRDGICTLYIDYKGLIDILTENGIIKMMDAGVIFKSELNNCEIVEGANGYVKKVRNLSRSADDEIVAAYSVAYFSDGMTHCHVLDKTQLEAREKVSATDKVRNAWPIEMKTKAAIRSHFKYLPKTVKTKKVEFAMEAIDAELQYKNNFEKQNTGLPPGINL